MSDDAIITVTHKASGATAKVHLFGATVTSYVSASKKEHLFCSQKAKLDGSKAIRAGIPIVFPIFGPPTEKGSTMPQHGFARCNTWEFQGTEEDDMYTMATFVLEYSKHVTAGCGENNTWAKDHAATDGTDVKLTYQVRVEAKELTTTLIVENTGTSSFNFNALFHTYFQVPDLPKLKVHGLGGYSITDKVSGDSGHVQSYDDHIAIQGEVDSVFIHPDNHPTIHAKLLFEDKDTVEHPSIRMEAAGQVDEQVSPVSCVVWNPGPTKAEATSDFGNDEYKNMVCVEPGLIGHQPLLTPGAQGRLSQSIVVTE